MTVLVPSYDDGLAFFCDVLGFAVLEDTELSAMKRWIVVAPSRGAGAALVLAVPSNERQTTRVGDQTGGRVGFFLHSGDFWADYERLLDRGLKFLETPGLETYGLVAVFLDPWGGKWDLLQPAQRSSGNAMRFGQGDLGAPDPVLGNRTGRPVADCLCAGLNDHALRRRHCSRLSSRPGRAQTPKARIQSPRRFASHSHGFCPDRRPFFILVVPVLGGQFIAFAQHLPGYAMRLQAIAVEEGNTFIAKYGGRWLDALGLRQQLSSAQIQKSVGDFVAQSAQWLLDAFTRVVSGGAALFNFLSLLIVTPVVAFYILVDWHRMITKLELVAPARPSRISAKHRARNK